MIHFPNEHLDLECLDTRETVAEACARAGQPLDLVCGGTGRCGQCKILIKNHGITLEVLACQYPVFDEMEILTGAEARQQILDQGLPLPPRDFVPVTLEEQLICWADKFFSKTHPEREKTTEQARHSLEKFGTEGLVKFDEWCARFS